MSLGKSTALRESGESGGKGEDMTRDGEEQSGKAAFLLVTRRYALRASYWLQIRIVVPQQSTQDRTVERSILYTFAPGSDQQ